jgi:broad specificity phosphatase PhoE
VVRPRWDAGPTSLTLVRHAHSVGNNADALAREAGAEELDLQFRDADVELSDVGLSQAKALGAWLEEQDSSLLPSVVLSSPYRRALQSAEAALAGLDVEVVQDERLRERDLGVFDGLTGLGIRTRYPDEAERRKKLGKFYYQPPSGESWCDVALRVRSLLGDLRWGYDDARVWLFTHQAVTMTFRYVLEGLSEERLLEIDREEPLPNASMTSYRRERSLLELVRFADTTAVDAVAEVTDEASRGSQDNPERDVPEGPRGEWRQGPREQAGSEWRQGPREEGARGRS